ncbi:Hypothetical protein A7982_10806 [Minicystis rosea]|nr:Hypothetical protein A7982_10806 [Minicystis rosea]
MASWRPCNTRDVLARAPHSVLDWHARCHALAFIMNDAFRRLAQRVAHAMGTSQAFLAAVLVIAVWAVSGPLFHYSDTWQLVINTGTTIITFLMVFLIQSTQNRDAQAIHLKLDELIRSIGPARDALINLEQLSDAELERLQAEFDRLSEHVGSARRRRSASIRPDAKKE